MRLLLILTLAFAACSGKTGNSPRETGGRDLGSPDTTSVPSCTSGVDNDHDGYGIGCPAGDDCNDNDPNMHPGAKEICDGKDNNCNNQTDEGVLTACGSCEPGCNRLGDSAFAVDPAKDPGVKDATGVGLDPAGDLVLDKSKVNFNYMWIANSLDTVGSAGGCDWASNGLSPTMYEKCRGTVSKIDTVSLKEVARYFTVTCFSKAGAAGCVDLAGKPITKVFVHAPSRTAVDYNFDVWVANRAFAGQPSATKIANEASSCVDRNKNGVIDTSKDQNGDGKITLDCDSDGKPDGASTLCAGAYAGKPPEFYGDDDECILFTVNYGENDDYGRSICLDSGIDIGPSNAWVGTNNHPGQNRFYKIDGGTGALAGPFDMPAGHAPYGCVVDSQHILWSAALGGDMAYLNTLNPTQVAPASITHSWTPKAFYGITTDDKDHIWLGGYDSKRAYRYKPNRTGFATLGSGTWTGINAPASFDSTRGIAADNRGKIWVAVTGGYIWRVDQSVVDGLVDGSTFPYWDTKGSGVIGVGVDFAGHIWGIAYNNAVASRLDVDSKGDPILPNTMPTKFVDVGMNPYTYSDFTGFGLMNFTRPQGRYLYQLEPCAGKKPTWKQVRWTATTPTSTQISVRVRSGDSETTFGSWFGPYQKSPAVLDKTAANPLVPNPSAILQVEFTLQTTDKQQTPVLHDFDVSFSCVDIPQ